MPSVAGVRRKLAMLTGRAERGPRILMYHRVADTRFDPWKLSVSPRRFDEHMRIVRKLAHPMGLEELPRQMEADSLPGRAVVVTFDDGYSDNLYFAKPILEKHGVPATVFATSGYIGGEREFWWDELERIVSRSAGPPASRRSRMRTYFSLWERLHPMPDAERASELACLRERAGDDGKPRGSHLPMTSGELSSLTEGGLVEVGGHTATHPALSDLPRAGQREEIRAGKAAVEAALGRRIASFSYPHGSFTSETVEEVGDAGFEVACSVEPGIVGDPAHSLKFPRVMVENLPGRVFEAWLSRLIGR